MGKTYKKALTGSKAVDPTCVNKSCPTCQMKKKYKDRRSIPIIEKELGWKNVKNF